MTFPKATRVHKDRIQITHPTKSRQGPVLYWMNRDMRVHDNWAFLHAIEEARKHDVSVAIVVSLVIPEVEHLASIRRYGFLVDGLKDVQETCVAHNIPFYFRQGLPQVTLPPLIDAHNVSLIVTDMSPLRETREWQTKLVEHLDNTQCGLHVVDAHNICPVWKISNKVEYAARTLRSKINKQLNEYLTEFPSIEKQSKSVAIEGYGDDCFNAHHWESLKPSLKVDRSIQEVDWCKGGEQAARNHFDQSVRKRLNKYDKDRNNPNLSGVSDISPWLHFGHIASQRCVIDAKTLSGSSKEAVSSFVEEILVRKELSDNFCYYNPDGYDTLGGLYPTYGNQSWAQRTLQDHANDKREHVYSKTQLEQGDTHEELWNAAQMEMVHHGKMHGFMRMYWAKKILEWTKSPEEALDVALYLNDKYSLDGWDPNGYVGCAWSIAGLHDQGWRERPIFGKIRYMNHAGCKRKFNVNSYVSKVQQMVKKVAK